MSDIGSRFPERIEPYITLRELSQPVDLERGLFRLIGPNETGRILEGRITFRWLPLTAIELEGTCAQPDVDVADDDLELQVGTRFTAPVFLTHALPGASSSYIRGVFKKSVTVGSAAEFDLLRFSLANFPDYIGLPIQYQIDGGQGVVAGRLQTSASLGVCTIDAIPEAQELRKRASRDAGFVVSHVGEWRPDSGALSADRAGEILQMLHIWFGLLRGAWAGPLFPKGISAGQVVWEQLGAWKLDEPREVPTWLPQRHRIDLSGLFAGFLRRWQDHAWRGPLTAAVSWFVEANAPRTALETRIVLAQVALDLLAWVHLVETQKLHSRADFKRISAAGRIRALLHHLGIPAALPDYLKDLASLLHGDAFDGPGIVTRVRNSLVHAAEDSRRVIASLAGVQLLECSQLALHYVELALLAVCGHSGYYARRGWRGWKGEDEVLVPWAQAG